MKDEIDHLESIQTALDIALREEDLAQIKEELIESGYIRRKGGARKVKITSRPFHYVSREGFHIYVGKITSRTTNSPSSSPPAMTGGFTPRAFPAPMW